MKFCYISEICLEELSSIAFVVATSKAKDDWREATSSSKLLTRVDNQSAVASEFSFRFSDSINWACVRTKLASAKAKLASAEAQGTSSFCQLRVSDIWRLLNFRQFPFNLRKGGLAFLHFTLLLVGQALPPIPFFGKGNDLLVPEQRRLVVYLVRPAKHKSKGLRNFLFWNAIITKAKS